MREENFGPVFNPDGSPTEFTKQMLAGTGRDPEELKPNKNNQRAIWFGQAIEQLIEYMSDPNMEHYSELPIRNITVEMLGGMDEGTWMVRAFQFGPYQNRLIAFPYVIYINDDTGDMVMDG